MANTDTPVALMSDLLRAVETQVLTTDIFKDEQIAFFTSRDPTCFITDAAGNRVEVPTYYALMGGILGSDGATQIVASKLSQERILELTGAVRGQIPFDGSKDVAIVTAVPDGALSTRAVAGLDSTLQTISAKADQAVATAQAVQTQLQSLVGGYTYNQVEPAPVWVVIHGLNRRPAVTVIDTAGTELAVGVDHVDLNRVIISSAYPIAGTAIFT